MTLYIAAPYGQKERVKRFIASLPKDGFHVVSTWHASDQPEVDFTSDQQEAFSLSLTCLEQIELAEAFVLLSDCGAGFGSHVEYGYALMHCQTILIIGPAQCLFWALAEARFDHDADAIAYLKSAV